MGDPKSRIRLPSAQPRSPAVAEQQTNDECQFIGSRVAGLWAKGPHDQMSVSLIFVGHGPSGSMSPQLLGSEAYSAARRLRLNTAAAGRTVAKRAVTILSVIVAGWLMSLGFGTASAHADNSPVMTESFESVSGLPPGWKFIEYTPRNSTVTIVKGAAAEGTHFLRIVSSQPNHARVVVPVRVTPNTNYQFQAMVKASGANANMAAVLGTYEQYTATNSVRTDTRWQLLDLYVKVGPQTTIDLTMGLGHFGQLNVGTADFDAVAVTQVNTIPNGATVADLATPTAAQGKPETAAGSTFSQGPNKVIWVFVGILIVVGIGAAVFLMRHADTKSTPEGDTENGRT